jgi:hypothetical protein
MWAILREEEMWLNEYIKIEYFVIVHGGNAYE